MLLGFCHGQFIRSRGFFKKKPVKKGALNIVMGVNDQLYAPNKHHLLTAASCTTNCLAPAAKVIQEAIGIRRGMITTIHGHDQQSRPRAGLLAQPLRSEPLVVASRLAPRGARFFARPGR